MSGKWNKKYTDC